MLLVFTYLQEDLMEAWLAPDMRIFIGLKSYFSLAIPSTISLVLDWWVWELMVLISGYLGVVEQASCILIMQICALSYQVAIGLEQASCTLIGRQIGKGDVQKAKLFYKSFQWITTCMVATTSILVYFLKERIISLFTTDTRIQKTATSVLWIISLSNFPDGYKGMLKGVVRALGLQGKSVYINIVGHWCINLTLQWLLGFHYGWGLTGMWLGKLVLELFIFSAYNIMISCTDWNTVS